MTDRAVDGGADRGREGELLTSYLSRARRPRLDGGMKVAIVDVLHDVLEGAYAHLGAKRAAYAVDPLQALVLLRRQAPELTEAEFHRALTRITSSLRDAHTRYAGPPTSRVAVLPFLVEAYGPESEPVFVVTKRNPDLIDDDRFVDGVLLRSWNGVPVARAVELHAGSEAGGRPDARRARALESLTFRALDFAPPPDEMWVIVGYTDGDSEETEVRIPWRVFTPGKARTAVTSRSRGLAKLAADPAAEAVRRAKKQQFAADLWQAEWSAGDSADRPGPAAEAATTLDTPMQDVLGAQRLRADLGALRIWSFDVGDDDAFLAEVTRLLKLLPQRGVVVDLRGNPGGLIWAAERMLQLFTDTPIQPTRFSLAATPLTRAMADSPFNRLELEPWGPSLQDAVTTGEMYAQPLPLTDPAWCNDLDWRYPGRAVAVVDATTYSAGDLFAAGWVDHAVGPLVCVGQATGGGGANVWTSHQLRDALGGTDHPMPALPEGAGFTLAFRRAVRSAAGDGIPIEDLGIGGIPYTMTSDDVLHGNRDLYAFCSRLLDEPS